MRAEDDMEFRIYCEDVEGCPIGIVTGGVLNLFADLCDNAPERSRECMRAKGVPPRQRDSHVKRHDAALEDARRTGEARHHSLSLIVGACGVRSRRLPTALVH